MFALSVRKRAHELKKRILLINVIILNELFNFGLKNELRFEIFFIVIFQMNKSEFYLEWVHLRAFSVTHLETHVLAFKLL